MDRGYIKGQDKRLGDVAEPFGDNLDLPTGPIKTWVIIILLFVLGYTWLVPKDHVPGTNATPVEAPLPVDLTEQASRAFLAMESANRGFLLTGDQSYRDSFNLERDRFSDCYKTMLARTSADPSRQDALHAIKDKLTKWFRIYNPMIQERRDNLDYHPDRNTLLKCRLLHEEIMTDLANLNANSR